MKRLQEMSTGMKIRNEILDRMETCEICCKAKQTRLPFKTERTKTVRALQIIHTDLCGPINPETWDGKKYILTVIDDFTHYTMIYLLKNKYEVTEVLINYVNKVERQKNLKVNKIRCDNGREYINKKLKNWVCKKGVELDCTIPHTPQLNGTAERMNRTIMEKARSLLFDSNMKKNMWGEAAYTAVYLINRSPTR